MSQHENKDQSMPNRRDFLKTALVAGVSAKLATSALPNMKMTPEERADAWFDSKMAERKFVSSPFGAIPSPFSGIDQKNVMGYWSGGPGASASTIYHTLRGSGGRQDPLRSYASYPLDADDFGRCKELLDLVPEWQGRIGEMAKVSPKWAGLTPKWAQLDKTFNAGQKAQVTKMIKAALA